MTLFLYLGLAILCVRAQDTVETYYHINTGDIHTYYFYRNFYTRIYAVLLDTPREGNRPMRIDFVNNEINPVQQTIFKEDNNDTFSLEMNINPEIIHQIMWRIDFIKLSSKHILIVFQGFYAGIFEFGKSLDCEIGLIIQNKITGKSRNEPAYLYPIAHSVLSSITSREDIMEMFYRKPSKEVNVIAEFDGFPINNTLNMVVFMKGMRKKANNMIGLRPRDEPEFWPIAVLKNRREEWQMARRDYDERNIPKLMMMEGCPVSFAEGDIHHIIFHRASHLVFEMQMLYANGTEEGVICTWKTDEFLVMRFDRPLELVVKNNAIVLQAHMHEGRTKNAHSLNLADKYSLNE